MPWPADAADPQPEMRRELEAAGSDGRILQTMTAWGSDPVWPTQLARYQALADRHTEQLALATDRDGRVVEGVREACADHRSRVAASRGAVPAHERLADFVALCPQSWWVDTMVVLGAAVLTLPLYIRVWLRARRWRRLRPRFRAPVPGTSS